MLNINNENYIIALAGLLHDIGKLLNRCDDYMGKRYLPNKKHQQLSVDFLKLLKEKNILKENELLTLLVQKHHEHHTIEEQFRVNSIKNTYQRVLAYLISRADNYSSSERRDGENKSSYFKTQPLDSLFNKLEINNNKFYNENSKYKLKEFSCKEYENVFPKNFEKNTQEEIKELVDKFISELDKLNTDDFEMFFKTLFYILRKYTWCLPSDTTKNICDISLFDHLKTTSAIALCSYLYHKENNSLDEKSAKDDKEDKFLIIGCDIEGISEYINDINTTKNASKRLRGKSFFANLLVKSISYKIIKELNLTIANNIINIGNRFYILAPKTYPVKEKLLKIKRDINDYLFNEFEASIYFNLTVISVCGEKLRNFREIVDEINHKLQKNSNQKYKENILKNPVISFDFEIGGVCPICQKYFKPKNNDKCRFCENEINIGTYVTKSKYIAYYSEDINYNKKIKIFNDIYVVFLEDKNDLDNIDKSPYIVMNLQDTEILTNYPSGFEFYANYAPTYESLEEYRFYTKKDDTNYENDIKSFEAISSQAQGVKNLGILKLDLDNLQLLMDVGLFGKEDIKNLPDYEEDEKSKFDYTSISRISNLSTMINTFLIVIYTINSQDLG
ncbi:type III-A CRISPR-associated protein Cas10/Csm1 [Tepidibacter thalassicus]|uniref:CRISPR-associated protein Csm1 n=1 Tax=Tepidibacter thalassicus DSM 15285 TaxID=1123350 RepID=A0A1M5TEG8_9FIRM|nr:type III-A CRISPR-associated protein Cas10/Csm1 [Tepidibacter thalassicus]SHH49106.1 CRISPR-associated protein Csm1 [Tepidibacter thalassicus DSM 15285]